eukprot:TRINITY_DN33530_c0_g1_i1.p1 TRINITY_DN33530_c0_g1~~TRINITY_DN33530_c0_g1_i1.p1  ORF type:complete len:662 (+),score=228.65 TRINITY_DN33530_c0_g1_i1:184-2169(+)
MVLEDKRQIDLQLVDSNEDKGWFGSAPPVKADPKDLRKKQLVAQESVPTDSWLSLATTNQVKRGYGTLPAILGEVEEDLLGEEASQRIFVLVHGIGEKMWSECGSGMMQQVDTLRVNVHKQQLLAAGWTQTYRDEEWVPPPGGASQDSLPKDDILRASWWQIIHTEELDSQLKAITLPRVTQVREFANYAVMDAVFYMQPQRRAEIVRTVVASINGVVSRYKKHHPEFQGDVFLIGHSLGGLIVFDMLRRGEAEHGAKLDFTPSALFTLGSPTAMFLHCAGDTVEPGYKLPGGTRFFNLFHPLDPVAYRMEPLLAPEMAALPPVQVTEGGVKFHHKIGSLLSWASGGSGTGSELTEEQQQRCDSLKLNDGERFDFALQEGLFEGATEIVHAISSHCGYPLNVSVAAFLYTRAVAVMTAKENRHKSGTSALKETEPGPLEKVEEEKVEEADAPAPQQQRSSLLVVRDAAGSAFASATAAMASAAAAIQGSSALQDTASPDAEAEEETESAEEVVANDRAAIEESEEALSLDATAEAAPAASGAVGSDDDGKAQRRKRVPAPAAAGGVGSSPEDSVPADIITQHCDFLAPRGRKSEDAAIEDVEAALEGCSADGSPEAGRESRRSTLGRSDTAQQRRKVRVPAPYNEDVIANVKHSSLVSETP